MNADTGVNHVNYECNWRLCTENTFKLLWFVNKVWVEVETHNWNCPCLWCWNVFSRIVKDTFWATNEDLISILAILFLWKIMLNHIFIKFKRIFFGNYNGVNSRDKWGNFIKSKIRSICLIQFDFLRRQFMIFFYSGNSSHKKGNKRNAELLDDVHDHLSLTQQTSPVTSTSMDVVRDHFNQAIHLNQLKLSNGGGSKVSSNEEDEEVLQQPLVRKSNYC